MIPSQFAVFFANEIDLASVVIELGSGNGRDAMFLGKCVHHVLAVDGSEAATNSCITEAKQQGIKNIDFIHSLIDEPDLLNKVKNKLLIISDDLPIYIFSRFFLHSISEQDEDKLIFLIAQLLDNHNGAIYLEFRTIEDELLSKYTDCHYRRYVDPARLIKKFNDLDYSTDYHVQGVGFAKYKVDDAHVARLVFSRIK